MRFFLFFLLIVITNPLLATESDPSDWDKRTDLWKAFDLYEQERFEEAAQIIQNYRVGCPLAHRYYRDLHNRGFINEAPIENKDIILYDKFQKNCFDYLYNSSKLYMQDGNPQKITPYYVGRRLENKTRQGEEHLPARSYQDSDDPRAFLALARLRFKKKTLQDVMFRGVSRTSIAQQMIALMQNNPNLTTKDLLFACYEKYAPNLPGLESYFLNWAAMFGHEEAQLLSARKFNGGLERDDTGMTQDELAQAMVFWSGLTAARDDLEGLNLLANAFLEGVGVPKDPQRALMYFQRAADREQAGGDAHYFLGNYHTTDYGGGSDFHQALPCFQRAHELGYQPAAKSLARVLLKLGHFAQGFELLETAAQRGDLPKDANFLDLHTYLPQTSTEATHIALNLWLEKAQTGSRLAQELCLYYFKTPPASGPNISDDETPAWLKFLVAEENFPFFERGYLLSLLGAYYFQKRDFVQAHEYLEQAVALENLPAFTFLAQIYEKGLGRDPDTKRAIQLYGKAPNNDQKYNNYGVCLMQATAPTPMMREIYDKQAKQMFEKSIQLGPENNAFYFLSCYNLGLLYTKGRIEQNNPQRFDKGEDLLLKAAKAGDSDAMYDLALYYLYRAQIREGLPPILEELMAVPGATVQKLPDYNPTQGKKRNFLASAKKWCYRSFEAHDNDNTAYTLAILELSSPSGTPDWDKVVRYLEQAYESQAYSNIKENAKILLSILYEFSRAGLINLDTQAISVLYSADIQRMHQILQDSSSYRKALMDLDTSDSDDSDGDDVEATEILPAATAHADNGIVPDSPPVAPVDQNNEANAEIQTTDEDQELQTESQRSRNAIRLEHGVQQLKGRKQMKWRKVQKLMNLAIKVEGEGRIKDSKGSGTHVKVGKRKTNIHKPHKSGAGKDTEAGRLQSLAKVIEDSKDKN